MLSNTATPKYYGIWREKVLSGEIPVNHEVEMEMNRIDALIADPNFYYDGSKVEGWRAFCETELTLTDGSDLHLLETFSLWGEELWGWYYFQDLSVFDPDVGTYVIKRVKRRLTKKQYLIVARGAAKTLYESCVQAFVLVCDTSTTDQVTVAPVTRQAEEVLSPIKTAISRARGPVFQFLTEGSLQNTTGSRAKRQKLFSSKKGIENTLTNSIIRIVPMTIDKMQGLRSKVVTIDEWLSGDVREDVVSAAEQGCSKLDDYLIVATSSEGTVRNGPGDDIKLELMKILKGEYYAPHVSIWYYKLDSIDEVGKPETWLKANPNLGKTVRYEAYHADVLRAENSPAARNDILAKRFNLPLEGYTYFFSYADTIPHPFHVYWGLPCALGADLSRGDDFCAFTFLFPLPDGRFGVKCRNYITERTLYMLPMTLRERYEEFIKEGSLIIMQGTVLDMLDVYDDLDTFIDHCRYDVLAFGYDPYNAKAFMEKWAAEHGGFGIEKVIQGSRTESVPLGELKKFAEDRTLLFDEKAMSFAMGNAITIEDTNGNRKLCKRHSEQKIDPVAALMDAYIAYKLNQESFA